MNLTAVLHASFAALVIAGVFTSGILQIGLFGAGVACFVAGIVVARQSDDDGDARPA